MDETTKSSANDQQLALHEVRTNILGVVATLIGIGIVAIYSASAVRAGQSGWEFEYVLNQIRWLVIGVAGMSVMSLVDYRQWQKWWPALLLVIVLLLVAVRVPGVGTKVRGAYRWLRVGGFNMQPSELAKLVMVMVVASLLARRRDGRLRFWADVLPVAGVIALASGLVVIEPDFGTGALLGAVLLALLIVGGARWWQVAVLVLAGTPPVVYYGLTRFTHIVERVNAWWLGETQGAGWQPWMSKVALGSGGLFGVGAGQGMAKLYFLPDAHTDFILAIIGQEFGLAGAGVVTALFLLFVYEGLRLVRHAPDRFGALLAFGIITQIGLQAAFNIAVVTATIPPKGISLPFISFGGSGLCVSLASVGLLVSICRHGLLGHAVEEDLPASVSVPTVAEFA